jgi:hypothetical protein
MTPLELNHLGRMTPLEREAHLISLSYAELSYIAHQLEIKIKRRATVEDIRYSISAAFTKAKRGRAPEPNAVQAELFS